MNILEENNLKFQNKNFKNIDWLSIYLFIVLFVVLLTNVIFPGFVYSKIIVMQSSMYPTLVGSENKEHPEDLIGILHTKNAVRGDIVVFVPPYDDEEHYVKRVVAVGGDKVCFASYYIDDMMYYKLVVEDSDGNLIIDGNEDYINEYMNNYRGLIPSNMISPNSLTIPQDCYYVLGDNRNHSTDSRSFGCIKKSSLVGVAKKTYRIKYSLKLGKVNLLTIYTSGKKVVNPILSQTA